MGQNTPKDIRRLPATLFSDPNPLERIPDCWEYHNGSKKPIFTQHCMRSPPLRCSSRFQYPSESKVLDLKGFGSLCIVQSSILCEPFLRDPIPWIPLHRLVYPYLKLHNNNIKYPFMSTEEEDKKKKGNHPMKYGLPHPIHPSSRRKQTLSSKRQRG